MLKLKIIIIIINLGLASPSKLEKLGARKGHMIEVAWERQERGFKSLRSCSRA